MKKLVNLEKNSFSLFETIIAITIISILLGGFLKSSSPTLSLNSNFEDIKNYFLINNTNEIKKLKSTYSYNIQNNIEVTISNSTNNENMSKLVYKKNNIYLEKFILNKHNTVLNYKDF